jgi:SAM-dependent methyltransferase
VIPDTPGRPTRAGGVQRLVNQVAETEYEHLKLGNRLDPVVLPWMPYQPADFLSIMWDVMGEAGGPVFLDVGCGPGTKMRIAKELLGMIAYGIEIDKRMANIAKAHGTVYPGDALWLPTIERAYALADVIWLYRPFRSAPHEASLENFIIANMKPGAILAGGSWETDPAALGWQPVVDDCIISPDGAQRIFRGAWQKPKLAA